MRWLFFYGSGDCISEEDWDRMEDLSQMEQDEKYAGKVEQSVGFPSPLIGENENQRKLRLVPTLKSENLHISYENRFVQGLHG
jgi:hypothetical protein